MGENAKVKVREKLARREKGKMKEALPPLLSPVSSRYIFVFALSQFSGPGYLGAWNRLVKASPATPCWQLPTQNPMRTLPLWMLLQCPSIRRTRGRSWGLPCHMYTIPWMAVENEIPSFATGCALIDSKGTGPGNTKSSVRKVFIKDEVLHRQWKSRK